MHGTQSSKPWLGTFISLFLSATFLCGETARPLMKDFVGINGHTIQFKPTLYQPVCRLVRDYHPVEWDLGKETAVLPRFPLAKNGVDWGKVYGSWQRNGWVVDVSLMFESIRRTNWVDIEGNARAYGEVFAREFGPSGQRRLVESVEIGNEPGKWSDSDYTKIFGAMARGIREGDSKIKITTCNLTTHKSGDYEKSVECVANLLPLVDVLNVHSYAQLAGWPTWRRSFPEDPKLKRYLQDVEALCSWRDVHARDKPVWITEFGYDSSTRHPEAKGDAANWVGVSDQEQAQWLVRSLLVFSAMPVERAYIYFFNDQDKPSLHASSGITRNFEPKPSFYALSHLQRVLGDFRFVQLVTNEPANLRVQEYRNASNRIIWAVWSQTGENKTFSAKLERLPGKLVEWQPMVVTKEVNPSESVPVPKQKADHSMELTVSESPTYLVFEK